MKRALAFVLYVLAGCASRAPGPAKAACSEAAEVLAADVFVVADWRAAYAKSDGFDEEAPDAEKDARAVLCRMDACTGAPPWLVKAHLFPFRFPSTAIAPLADGRLAVIPLGLTGMGQCIDGHGDVANGFTGHMEGDLVVLEEEVQPLAFVEEGRCEARGPVERIRRVIDPHRKRQTILKSTCDVDSGIVAH